MTSTLEMALLADDRCGGNFRSTLFDQLDDGTSPTTLRLCSRVLHHLINQRKHRIFRDLYLCLPRRRHGITYSIPALRRLAPFCTRIVVKVMYGETNSPYSRGEADQTLVSQVFHLLRHVTTVLVCVNGDPVWPGCTQTEDVLITLRLALQRSRWPALRTIHLEPVHAAGLIHLRHASFGAFREQPFLRLAALAPVEPQVGAEIWTKLATLDLRMRNPAATGRVSGNQMMMFFQVLEDYLRSFHRTLRCLRFVWLDAPGPSPLILGDMLERESLVWSKLEHFSYGNITQSDESLKLITTRMPKVNIVRRLIRQSPHPRTSAKDEEWQTVHVPRAAARPPPHTLATRHPTAQLSQLSLVPAPLSLSKVTAGAQPPESARPTSSVYSRSMFSHNEHMSTGDPDILDDMSDTGTIRPTPASSHNEPLDHVAAPRFASVISATPRICEADEPGHVRKGVRPTLFGDLAAGTLPESRMAISRSVYSRDENGDYVPVRHQWKRLEPDTQRMAQPPRGLSALLESGRRLSSTLRDAELTKPSSPWDVKKHAVVPTSHPANWTDMRGGRNTGHDPPAVPPNPLNARNHHIDLGDLPAYKAARDQHLQEHPDSFSGMMERRCRDPGDRIRQWARTVKSGRPTSTLSTRTMNTMGTRGSRPLSKFFGNLRATGKPSKHV